jgi:hypothetical protein
MDFPGALLSLIHEHPWSLAVVLPAAFGYACASLRVLQSAYRVAATAALVLAPMRFT